MSEILDIEDMMELGDIDKIIESIDEGQLSPYLATTELIVYGKAYLSLEIIKKYEFSNIQYVNILLNCILHEAVDLAMHIVENVELEEQEYIHIISSIESISIEENRGLLCPTLLIAMCSKYPITRDDMFFFASCTGLLGDMETSLSLMKISSIDREDMDEFLSKHSDKDVVFTILDMSGLED
jgi:hypothetical protein